MERKFSIFNWLLIIITFLILLMLWWSSLLIEKDLKKLTLQFEALCKKIDQLPTKLEHMGSSSRSQTSLTERPHINPNYPNLLQEDPFFINKFSSLLPKDFEPHGARREAMIGKPENLHPFNGFANVSSMIAAASVSIAQPHFGKFEPLAPDMAIKIEKREESAKNPKQIEYWIHLRDNVFWQPLNQAYFSNDICLDDHFFQKHKVTAHDYKFYFDAIMNPYVSDAKATALRTYYQDIEEFRVIDDLTFIIRWKQALVQNEEGKTIALTKYGAENLIGALQPLARFVFQYFSDGEKIVEEDTDPNVYRTHSVWAQNFSEHWAKNYIVSCGPWIFEGMSDEKISFRRNPEHYFPHLALTEQLIYIFKESPEAIFQEFKAGNIDFCQLMPNQLLEYERFTASPQYQKQRENGFAIKTLDYAEQAYYYLGWNQMKPYFTSANVRRALTMAIDRDRIIAQNLNEMGIALSGPFSQNSYAYDKTIPHWEYHPDEARELLTKEGWIDQNGDGIRDKCIEGKIIPFRFELIYFIKSQSSKVIVEYIKSQLQEVGIHCILKGVDLPDLSRHFDDKSFDAIYMGWKLGAPPEDPKQLWHSSGASLKGSSNAIGFANETIDQIIEKLTYESDREKREKLYHHFHKIIHESAPYTFLYSPKVRLLYRENMQNVFLPSERADLVPGANISEPDLRIVYFN